MFLLLFWIHINFIHSFVVFSFPTLCVLFKLLVVLNLYHMVWIIAVAVANNFMHASVDFIDVCVLEISQDKFLF